MLFEGSAAAKFLKQTVAKKAINMATTNFTVWPEPI